jgi:hypothetical protein
MNTACKDAPLSKLPDAHFQEGFRNLANPINNQHLYVHYDRQTTG